MVAPARIHSDNLKWDQSEELFEQDTARLRKTSQFENVKAVAETALGTSLERAPPLVTGGFHMLYPFRPDGGSPSAKILVRVPFPSQGIFHEENLAMEVATARYLAQHTQLPIPKVYHYGVDPRPGIGPFLMMEDLGSKELETMSRSLSTPHSNPAVLDPNMPEGKLKSLYRKMAECVLQLAQPSFPCIGALVETSPGSGSQRITGRPITLNMINMVQLSNVPKSIFPPKGTTYRTTDEWYMVLAEQQMATLLFQHNDIISSRDDCRTKYVARQLFRRLAKQGRLSSYGFAEDDWSARAKHCPATLPMPSNSGSFRLWCDDFRPANVLVTENDEIAAVFDWEFTFAGPTQLVLDPPWWLLLDTPDSWDNGIEDWEQNYEKRLPTWLSALQEAEKEMKKSGTPFLLSAYMRDSWATGRFWLNYAARKSWAFDAIYWKYLDEKFFGKRDPNSGVPKSKLWKTRIHLLSPEEQAAMDTMVEIKMEESKERILVDWEDTEARQRLKSFLFD
ncbi:phosphotransferase [Colletotrichum lupini]|uniref:Phosphotransferase n=1 Tax=Colletotrichum lupini TaxID=145971 RepID=A0A9Q8WPP2_9PEZI|nr:phosphotransferase [Colletotrichum lupini]KAK1710688.1 hypothetical protein BDP67DRAFT_520565 [Colletotrichum lupini]UQC90607.1 phosphotransferase [Colletotrichum lupini]